MKNNCKNFLVTAFPFFESPRYPLVGVLLAVISIMLYDNITLLVAILFLSLIGNYLFVYNFIMFNSAYNYQTDPIDHPSLKVKFLCYIGDITYCTLAILSALCIYSLYLKTGFSWFTGSLIVYLLLLPTFNLWYQWFIRR